ncbi:MAG: hypothetical protein RL150_488 [Candidatus Parcubacteria bacterium]
MSLFDSAQRGSVLTGTLAVLAVICGLLALSFIPRASVTSDTQPVLADAHQTDGEPVEPETQTSAHVPIPSAVKALYMSACVVGTDDFRQELVDLVNETELNSIIIDIKDFSGTISFAPQNDALKPAWDAAQCGTTDMREFIAALHEQGIYVIGRITVFQDPFYTKQHPELAVQRASDRATWKDHKGLSFIDVSAKPYWEYVLLLAKESYDLGFDELNFDYVRFPSDGDMNNIYFPHSAAILDANGALGKQVALEKFFQFLDAELRGDKPADSSVRPIISADLFGMTTTNTDDLNIGQVQERALPYFDYLGPMVYPSHYPNGFNGWSNPNHYPYELIHYVMSEGVQRIDDMLAATSTPDHVKAKISKQQLRPWIQDFDYGGDYGPKEVRAQIQATYDVGLTSWMLWAPSNRYTRGALLEE